MTTNIDAIFLELQEALSEFMGLLPPESIDQDMYQYLDQGRWFPRLVDDLAFEEMTYVIESYFQLQSDKATWENVVYQRPLTFRVLCESIIQCQQTNSTGR